MFSTLKPITMQMASSIIGNDFSTGATGMGWMRILELITVAAHPYVVLPENVVITPRMREAINDGNFDILLEAMRRLSPEVCKV